MLLRLTPLLILLGLTWAQPRPNRFQSNNTSLLKYLHKDPPNNRATTTNEPATGKRVPLKSAKPLVDISRNRLVPLNTTKPVPSPVVITLKQNRQHSSRHGQAGIDIENPRPNVPAKLVKKITQDSSPTTSTKIENTRLNGLAKLVKKNKQDSSPSTSNKISPLPLKLKMKQNNTDNSSRVLSSNKTKLAPMSLKLKNKQIRDKDQQTSRPLSSDITKLSLISSKLKTKRTSNDVEKSSTLNSPTMNSNNSPMKPFMKFNKILESTNSKKNPLNNPSDVSAAKTSLNNVSFPNLKKVVVQDQNIKQQISSKIRLTTKPTTDNERKRRMPADRSTSSNSSRGQKNVKFTSARDSHQAVANVSGL